MENLTLKKFLGKHKNLKKKVYVIWYNNDVYDETTDYVSVNAALRIISPHHLLGEIIQTRISDDKVECYVNDYYSIPNK